MDLLHSFFHFKEKAGYLLGIVFLGAIVHRNLIADTFFANSTASCSVRYFPCCNPAFPLAYAATRFRSDCFLKSSTFGSSTNLGKNIRYSALTHAIKFTVNLPVNSCENFASRSAQTAMFVCAKGNKHADGKRSVQVGRFSGASPRRD